MKKVFAFLILGLLVFYLVGPTPDEPLYADELPDLPPLEQLQHFVAENESSFDIKPDNEAEIVWHDPANKTQTDVAIVYLHGFTASKREGSPVHRYIARYFGCNLYLARLADHGIRTDEALLDYTAEAVWQSAVEAYAIGKKLGREVIIMSTSTGGTLALKLAATYPDIKALVNYSPNIEINDPAAFLLNDPWGLQIARIVFGGNYRDLNKDEEYRKYWYDKYRLEAIAELQELIETAATEETFNQVTCPVFNGVYYKDEEHQDDVVRVSAVREMHEELGTPSGEKELKEFPDAGTHVIAYGESSGAIEAVESATVRFLEETAGMEKSRAPEEMSANSTEENLVIAN
jgi:esterase/lipase